MDSDEGPAKVQFDKIPTLKPAFDKAGSVTAANASTINDGAAALVLMSADKAKQLGLKPLAKLVSYGSFAQEPEWFTTAPAEAMRRALKKAGWDKASVDLWEVNEAFAVVSMAARKELEIPNDKLNVWGGGISLGHPIGASGARILVTLISALKDKGLKKVLPGFASGAVRRRQFALRCSHERAGFFEGRRRSARGGEGHPGRCDPGSGWIWPLRDSREHDRRTR